MNVLLPTLGIPTTITRSVTLVAPLSRKRWRFAAVSS